MSRTLALNLGISILILMFLYGFIIYNFMTYEFTTITFFIFLFSGGLVVFFGLFAFFGDEQ